MATPPRTFDHLREHSIGLPGVLFQSITHMAPAAAVAYSIYISVPEAGPALPLSVALALVACLCAATAIGQLAKQMPSAGGLYTYAAKSLGPAAGFYVAWLFICFAPLVAPFLYLEFGWAMREVMTAETGFDWAGQWWMWVLVMTVIVFLLTYRDIRLSTNAGIILGAFEIAVFGALALWMLFSNAGDLTAEPFNPANAEHGSWEGIFKGMVFAILAFIGFEASAPLGEEAKHPRRTVPLAVVGSALAIGAFYILCSYAWVFGAGFDNFIDQATGPDPWRDLGETFWGIGWVVVFMAIVNSIVANSNAGMNAATRVLYAMGRNGAAPHPLARTHPSFKTPHIAIIVMSLFACGLALTLGFVWDPLTGFAMIATLAVIVVVIVYMLICLGCIKYYLTERRSEFNPFLHLVLPIAGGVLFFFPLYYQYKTPPDYPFKYMNWFAIGWIALGIVVTAVVAAKRPQALSNALNIYVEDETVEPAPAPEPAS